MAAGNIPELRTIIQVERSHCARSLRGFHRFDDGLRRGFRQCRKDSAAVKPAHALFENFLPLKITRLQLRRRFVATIVKHHRRAHALPAVAVNGGHVGPVHAVVFEMFVKRLHAHGAHAFRDQIANRIFHHRGRNAGVEAKTIGEICGDVKFTAADVDIAVGRFAEGNNARIQPMHQRAQR